jgi:hypothetical protein
MPTPTPAVTVVTQIENPEGTVLVQAVAHADRMDDAHPIAGFYVRRRYHGDTFLIARPEDFSPIWMRFVNDPPKEWKDKLGARLKTMRMDEDISVDGLVVEKEDPNRQFSMSELQAQQPRQSGKISYKGGRPILNQRAPR